MVMRVFLDTNILLDTIVARDNPQFARNAATILSLGENGTLELYMSALSIPTIAYVLKGMSLSAKKTIIGELVDIVKVLPLLSRQDNVLILLRVTNLLGAGGHFSCWYALLADNNLRGFVRRKFPDGYGHRAPVRAASCLDLPSVHENGRRGFLPAFEDEGDVSRLRHPFVEAFPGGNFYAD